MLPVATVYSIPYIPTEIEQKKKEFEVWEKGGFVDETPNLACGPIVRGGSKAKLARTAHSTLSGAFPLIETEMCL